MEGIILRLKRTLKRRDTYRLFGKSVEQLRENSGWANRCRNSYMVKRSHGLHYLIVKEKQDGYNTYSKTGAHHRLTPLS